MNKELAQWIANIKEHPHDVMRNVFADWLEDNAMLKAAIRQREIVVCVIVLYL